MQLPGCKLQLNIANNVPTEIGVSEDGNNKTHCYYSNKRKIVSNCMQYNNARAVHLVLDTVNNSIFSNEYLSCFLLNANLIESQGAAMVAKQLLFL
jgi:hypothetical protein